MNAKSLRLDRPSPQRLLARILDDPGLVATVRALEPRALGRLIDHVGLEDAGEIVALATTEQLEKIFDDDLWKSERPGRDEAFDADRFTLWLEVMLEAGEDFVADKLLELPVDMVTLSLHRQILVVSSDALAASIANDGDVKLVDKALDGCLYQELGDYQIISRRQEGWDSTLAVLLALDKHDHALLERILERCCHMSSELIEENGGLYDVLSSDDVLEADLAAEREDRRAGEGFLSPSQAASFLALARSDIDLNTVLAQPRDPVTRAYFRELATPVSKSVDARALALHAAGGAGRLADLEQMLASLGAEDVPRAARPTFLLDTGGAKPNASALFKRALAALSVENPALHAVRMEELAYLCNVLVAGCPIDGRPFRPFEAIVAVSAVCNLGLGEIVRATRTNAAEILAREASEKLFRVGWRLLHLEVAMATCDAVASAFLSRARGADSATARRTFEYSAKLVKEQHAKQKPWLARTRIRDLGVEPDVEAALEGLLGDYPLLVGPLAVGGGDRHELDRGRALVADAADLKRVRAFLSKL